MDHLAQHIESLVFTSESPITVEEIRNCLKDRFETKFKKGPIQEALASLQEKYQQEHFSFELIEIAGGFQFLTKTSYHNTIGTYLKQKTKKRLSKAALETLSIIAYKQPVVKSEMEKIRGVSCDYAVQKLLEKELVSIVGRGEGPGKPLQYGTSKKFMDYFGLKNINDLPQPKDFREPDNEIGEKAPIDEDTANQDHSTSDPAALRAKVAANINKAAAQRNEALVMDVSIAIAITEIIVDGGDLSNAVLITPTPDEEIVDAIIAPDEVSPENDVKETLEKEEAVIAPDEVSLENNAKETLENEEAVIAPDEVSLENNAKETLENEEAVIAPDTDQKNTVENTTSKFIPTTPIIPSSNIDELNIAAVNTNEELLENNIEELVQEIAMAVGIVEAFASNEVSDDTEPNNPTTADVDLKKKA